MTVLQFRCGAVGAVALLMGCLHPSAGSHALSQPIPLSPEIAALDRIAANHAGRPEQWSNFGVTFRISDHKFIRLRTILVLRLAGQYEDEGFRGAKKPRTRAVSRRLVLRYRIDLTRIKTFTSADTHAWIEVMCKDSRPCLTLDIRTPAGRPARQLHGADGTGSIAGFGRAKDANLETKQGSLIDALNRVASRFNGQR